jgi:hypothetical protein
VCTEKFNKSTRVKVTCPWCPFNQCASCAETYILGHSSDPHCMNCKKGWSRETLHDNFSNKFLNNTLKNRREALLFERERSLMPETQPYVEAEIKVRFHAKKIAEINKVIEELRKEAAAIYSLPLGPLAVEHGLSNDLEAEIIRHHMVIEKNKCIRACDCDIAHHNFAQSVWSTRGSRVASSSKRQFVRACPAADCSGFLSTSWKCGICEIWACPDCHEIKGLERDVPHTCNPSNIATAQLLARDSRNCPKCAAAIFKIDGCDQMWCTQCHTAFSWRTGNIETHRVHNPHYYDWMRQNGGLPREPGDVPCGGLPSIEHLREVLGAASFDRRGQIMTTRTPVQSTLWTIHRTHTHIQWVVLGRYIDDDRAAGNRDLRIKFMLKDFTDEVFKKKLQQREKAREKKEAIRQVLDMYQTVTIDLFRSLLSEKNCDATLQAFTNLRDHSNECFTKISKRFTNCATPRIGENFECW